jgi:PilZ domain-containing protein
MNVTRTASAAFTVAFDSENELRDEHRDNLSMGGLRLQTSETIALNTTILLTLRGPFGGEAIAKATVVAQLPDGLALAIDGDAEERLARLLAKTESDAAPPANLWDRIRDLTQTEKLLLAIKADRPERAVLLQDNDPRVLLSLLRNPRITVDEVVRVAKSSYLNFQIADVISKTAQWMSSLDLRLGLIHNAKTPQPLALRILPTLPDAEVRNIARSGTNMTIKTAALRQLAGR